ncbi:PilN domain-containing protein [Thalassotalea sp. PLHSN55]|uniref:PilN domain-containing protein n=1 Tax=Thalassotalea sp. PLHSN55 TaxID=3435888 RepID=UPI003F86B655
MSKYSINLFQAELIPEQPLLTLGRVVSLWVFVLVVMVLLATYSAVEFDTSTKQLKQLQASQKQNKQYLSDLEAQLQAKRSDPELTNRLALLKSVIGHKQALHNQLTDNNRTYVQGFSVAMSELSSLHHRDISLQQVTITNDDMTFSGLARRPEAVPAWLSGFEQSELLSGKSFVNFKLAESEEQGTEFVVSSIAGNKTL